MSRRRMSNPLALAVLAVLSERPMHPYEISTTLRERHKEESIKLNYGSLYTVVESLERAGFIRTVGTVRQGRRPERTIYAITESGRVELHDWMAELVSVPVKEYTRFEAALSLLGVLPPTDVVRFLSERRQRLIKEIEAAKTSEALLAQEGMPRLFFLETDYMIALRRAELQFVSDLIASIVSRTLDGIELWEAFHCDVGDPESMNERIEAVKRKLAEGRWGQAVADAVTGFIRDVQKADHDCGTVIVVDPAALEAAGTGGAKTGWPKTGDVESSGAVADADSGKRAGSTAATADTPSAAPAAIPDEDLDGDPEEDSAASGASPSASARRGARPAPRPGPRSASGADVQHRRRS